MHCIYLNVSDQQSEQHQATKNNDYAEYNFQPMTCRLKIIAKRTEKCKGFHFLCVHIYIFFSVKFNRANCIYLRVIRPQKMG